MTVFLVVSIIVLVGFAVAATLGRFGHSDLQLHPPASSAGGWGVDGTEPLRVADLADIRFDTAVRGYRMDQVDAMIARLQAGDDSRDPMAPTDADDDTYDDADVEHGHGAVEPGATPERMYPGRVHPFPRHGPETDRP